MANLPAEKRPVLGEEGMHYWLKQIAYQMPTHDSDSTKCHELNDEEKRVQGDYKGQMNDGVHVAKARETGLGDITVKKGEDMYTCCFYVFIFSSAITALMLLSGEVSWSLLRSSIRISSGIRSASSAQSATSYWLALRFSSTVKEPSCVIVITAKRSFRDVTAATK